MARSTANPLKTVEWKRARVECFRLNGHICYLCGHDNAHDVDHIVPKTRGGALFDQANLRPAHGVGYRRCPTCGRQCNLEKRAKQLGDVPRVQASRDWYAA